MGKILGIDLGTNSIGLAVRNTDVANNIQDQLEYFTSVIFKMGVGRNKNREYSYAAERTSHRSSRRLYLSRKYRIWATLKLLIEYDFCPLTEDNLNKWCKYDKTKGLKRQYPSNTTEFEQWVRLDFDGDGIADYSSPYQLRAELMEKQFDFSQQTDRFKLGRAIYHIAQRRGFKSSKGETLKDQEETEICDFVEMDISVTLKKSEEKESGDLTKYMRDHNLKTVGCAFASLENTGIRIRNSSYKAVRSQYEDEIRQIFKYQKGLGSDTPLYKRIMSTKKGEGTIFYKRPLRSQKGKIGKCTLEPTKSRCPISHPEYEEFRAWSLINNIKYRRTQNQEWESLSLVQKQRLFNEKFLRTTSSFPFSDIIQWIEREVGYLLSSHNKTVNYKERTVISGCPISGRLKNLLGEDWKNYSFETNRTRINAKTGELHQIRYSYEDIWHICFSYEEAEEVKSFAIKHLGYKEDKANEMARIWGAMQQGYAMLSLKAIRYINRFLHKGLIYTDAVLLAKLPEILGEELWQQKESFILSQIDQLIKRNREEKQILNIANNLISNYKILDIEEQFAYKNTDYRLDPSDFVEVEKLTCEHYGKSTWAKMELTKKQDLISRISSLYQQFFSSNNRDYYRLPKIGDALKYFISGKIKTLHCPYNFIDPTDKKLPCNCSVCKKLNKLYHPSLIEFYVPVQETRFEYQGITLSKKLLGSPIIGAFKNPVAMRSLHILRRQINTLIKDGIIEEDTKVVVELAREFNDSNMRWAIETYQREREKENKEFEAAIKRYHPTLKYSNDDVDKVRLLFEQSDLLEQNQVGTISEDNNKKRKRENYAKDVKKYQLWLEQGCICIYTGKPINISTLFDENRIDFEHTIPESISFDNSLANLTVCFADFNQNIKKNRIPTQLDNYEEILQRIQPWFDKIRRLKGNVEYYKNRSKYTQDKDLKDKFIRQRHLWEMELDYWQRKVDRFTITDVKPDFRNRQLVDTRIITKYAYHYLKSVFSNVEVQNGSVMSDFRKMLGIQSIEEKKDRQKHSHHAIDALVLTTIPNAAKRNKMLELFYQIKELKRQNSDTSQLEYELKKEIHSCKIGNISHIVEFIENHILINHLSKDQALTPAKKAIRIRGKIVPLKDNEGEIIYQTNEDGSVHYKLSKDGKWKFKLPKARYQTGDCIRGQLHLDSFYGAITQAEKNQKDSLLRNEEGKIISNEQIYYVIRRELKYKKDDNDTGFKNWEEIKGTTNTGIVDKALFDMMKKQYSDKSFKEACDQGIYMLDKQGNKVNKIRHIRCYASDIKNPLVIKTQSYLSQKSYKRNYYADVGDMYVMCKYQSEDLLKKAFKPYNLFEVAQNRKNNTEAIPLMIREKKQDLYLKQILKKEDMVLLYESSQQELKDMDIKDLMNRLYVVKTFEKGGNRIVLKKHINAKEDRLLGRGESIKKFDNLPEKIRCGINTLKYLLKGTDFEISSNGIIFYD